MHMDLQKLNEYFKSVIDLIPANSYFKQVQPAEKKSNKKKSRKRKASESEDEVKKFPKKRKFTANFMKTTSAQITEQEDDFEDVTARKQGKKWTNDEAPSLSMLQKRLRDRMEEIRAQRNPKNRSPEEIEKIHAKRKKERAKLRMKKKLKHQQSLNTGSAAAEMQGKPGQMTPKADRTFVPKVENSEGKAVFSKFDFGKEIEAKKNKKFEGKHKRKNDKNLKTLLAGAESKRQKIEHLKSTNPEEAETAIKKESWGKALAKAGGSKVKDDPELLKKSIKKEKSIKRQHAKKWQEREKNVQEKMQQRQDKRLKNIQARKDQVKDRKKAKRAKKMSKSIPGF